MDAKKVLTAAVIAAICACAVQTGCVTDAKTGETLLLGVIPVEQDEFAAAEAAANSMAEQGGLVGLLGVAAGAAFGIWRRIKEKDAKAALATATQATAHVAEKLAAMNKVECNEALDVLKKAQEQAEKGLGNNG